MREYCNSLTINSSADFDYKVSLVNFESSESRLNLQPHLLTVTRQQRRERISRSQNYVSDSFPHLLNAVIELSQRQQS